MPTIFKPFAHEQIAGLVTRDDLNDASALAKALLAAIDVEAVYELLQTQMIDLPPNSFFATDHVGAPAPLTARDMLELLAASYSDAVMSPQSGTFDVPYDPIAPMVIVPFNAAAELRSITGWPSGFSPTWKLALKCAAPGSPICTIDMANFENPSGRPLDPPITEGRAAIYTIDNANGSAKPSITKNREVTLS